MEELDYEKISYGKSVYKRVQRLRRKGQRRGMEVPTLNYELTKPEKPRIAFWIIAAVSAVLFVAILVGIGFLYNELVKNFSDLGGLGDFLGVLFKPEVLQGSLGLSALPGILLVVVYILVIVLFLLPLIAAVYFYRFVRDSFYMAKCSKEEFAKGNIVKSRITWLAVIMATATALLIVLLTVVKAGNAKLYSGLIYGGLMIALGGTFVLTVAEKVKCSKWFETLEEEKRQNYLMHEGALSRVKGRLNMEKRFWSNLGK